MVGDHAAHEIDIRIAAVLDVHVAVHFGVGLPIAFGSGRIGGLSGLRRCGMARMAAMRRALRQGKGRKGGDHCDEDDSMDLHDRSPEV
jgi:hypothetical protein